MGGISLTEEPGPGTPLPNMAGAAVSTVWTSRQPCNSQGPEKGWRGLCKGQFSIAKQEKPQSGKEDTDASIPCPQCHKVPALGTIPLRSC